MNNRVYKIVDDNCSVVGIFYKIDNAILFMETYFKKYYNEPSLGLKLIRVIENADRSKGD